MLINPPEEIAEKIILFNNHWVCKETLTDNEELVLFKYNQQYADACEQWENKFPYIVLANEEQNKMILYRGNVYEIYYDQYNCEMYSRCTKQPFEYASYKKDITYVEHGRYENVIASRNLDISDIHYVEGFITDRLHDYLQYIIQKYNISDINFSCIYSAQYNKPFRVGDHYLDTIANAYSTFYRNGKYWVVKTDLSGNICLLTNFNTFLQLASYFEKDLQIQNK